MYEFAMMIFRPLRTTLAAALLASTIMLSGCIGAFDEQPKRYNFVAGAKRPPMLNPGGIGNQAQEDAAQIAPAATQAALQSPATASPMAESSPMHMQQPMADAALTQGNVASSAEPSPLYYYEQQNAGVGSAELPASPLAAEVLPPAIEQKTSAMQQLDSALPPVAEDAEYPTLQSVQKPTPALQQSFDDAKANAQAFEAANPVTAPEPQPKQSAMMGVDVSQQPIQMPTAEEMAAEIVPLPTPEPSPLAASMPPASDTDTAMMPVAPLPQPDMMQANLSQQPTQIPAAQETLTTETTLADIPAETVPLPTPEQMPAPAPQFEGVPIAPEPSPLATSMPPATDTDAAMMPVAPQPEANASVMEPVAVVMPEHAAPATATEPQEPVINALAPTPVAPAMEASIPVYDPAQNTVQVPQAEPVATSPLIQASEPIRLMRPAYGSVREIPPSRYSRLRSNPRP
jgi:nicotinate-nucleotide--dimethylbenzimidazole phosphoribosyltransferase